MWLDSQEHSSGGKDLVSAINWMEHLHGEGLGIHQLQQVQNIKAPLLRETNFLGKIKAQHAPQPWPGVLKRLPRTPEQRPLSTAAFLWHTKLCGNGDLAAGHTIQVVRSPSLRRKTGITTSPSLMSSKRNISSLLLALRHIRKGKKEESNLSPKEKGAQTGITCRRKN